MITIELLDSKQPPKNNIYQSKIILNYDDWNDYGYRTSFNMFYCDDNYEVHEIGSVKIYYWHNEKYRNGNYYNHTRDSLDTFIKQLNKKYCSLGQDLSYYKNIKELLPTQYLDILGRLNDIVINDDLKNIFINENGVKSSLLRFSSAEKALNDAKNIIINNVPVDKDISFKYRMTMPYNQLSVDLCFDYKKVEFLPYRINALVGKNGTGKTQILSRLANALSGIKDERKNSNFVDKRPSLDKIISISYSAFDNFKKIPITDNNMSSYIYCGIQSETGTLSLEKLKYNLKKAYDKVIVREREKIWNNILSELLEIEFKKTIELVINNKIEEINLSSGQQIIICTMTEIIANIENESIILFDEPEIHLHPNAVSNIIRMFYRLLEQYNSYAIFSTHSPLILQEIPSKYIHILNRVDNMLMIREPNIECFGNNISEIIMEVFDVNSLESNYQTYLNKLSKEMTYDKVLNLFDNRLSLNAKIFLKNCY
jgi:ABC-type cobalt transport system, ATPase component